LAKGRESFTGSCECRCLPGDHLEPTNDHVDIERIEFNTEADPAGAIAVGLTVGWSVSPRRASEPRDEAPG
jgi:hypothetical protein